MTPHDRIVLDPAILAGRPIVRGTRLAVEFIIAETNVNHDADSRPGDACIRLDAEPAIFKLFADVVDAEPFNVELDAVHVRPPLKRDT